MEGHADNAGHGARSEPPFPRKYQPTRLAAFNDFMHAPQPDFPDVDIAAQTQRSREVLGPIMEKMTPEGWQKAEDMLRGEP